MIVSQLIIDAVIMQLLVILFVCQTWVFNLEIQDTLHDIREGVEELADITDKEKKKILMFNFWMTLEVVVLATFILANICYLLVRSFTKTTLDLVAENDLLTAHSDHLEVNIIVMGLIESFFTPALVSIGMLIYDKLLDITTLHWYGKLFMYF